MISRFGLTTRIAVVAALALAACSPGAGVPATSGPTGGATAGGTTAPTGAGAGDRKLSDLHVAFFESGSNNSYVQTRAQAARDWAKEVGAQVQVFDPRNDPTLQYSQLQTAFADPRFNGFVMTSVDPAPNCKIVQEAVANGKLISVMNQPLCDRATKSGDELWLPGTVTFVGGQTLDVYTQWMEFIAQDNPNGGKFAQITGPPTDANSQNMNTAIENVLLKKGFTRLANQGTDSDTPKAFAAAQDIIQAHPDVEIFLSNWSGQTQGVVQALKAAGKTNIKVYDMGGTKWALDSVRSGDIRSTVMFLPYLEGRRAIEALGDKYLGKEVPKFINLAKDPSLPNGSPFVTKENVDQYKGQY
jgi:ribose transport system substrate-binding protein